MKSRLSVLQACAAAFAFAGVGVAAEPVTLTGNISDSMCGLSHASMQAKHGGPGKLSDAQCTRTCVKAGAKYVLADRANGKIYEIADPGKVAAFAGERVEIEGTLEGDTLTVTKIERKR